MLQMRMASTLLILLISTSTLASGGHQDNSYSQPIDTVYEYGKSTYNGKINGVVVQYCIYNGTESTRVKRKTIKQLKNTSYKVLGSSLHNCSKPEQSIANLLNEKQLNAVAYYLNKRYKLNLSKN